MGLFLFSLVFFNANFNKKDFSGIQTQIIGVEDNFTDHLTSTGTLLINVFAKTLIKCPFLLYKYPVFLQPQSHWKGIEGCPIHDFSLQIE